MQQNCTRLLCTVAHGSRMTGTLGLRCGAQLSPRQTDYLLVNQQRQSRPNGSGSQRTASRILVVDDMQDSADALAVLLELQGYAVAVASGGLQAIRMSETFRPQIAVLDLGMPGMDGYALARRIRETPWGGAIHFIAFTGWSDEMSRTRATSAGFHQYLVKPVDPRRFIRIISEVELVA